MLDTASDRDVFVSYASQDSELANAVVLALERNGLSCWIAPRDVVPGDLYADGIIRAITASKVFVLVLSHNAIASGHVGKEVERASSKRRPIVALRTDMTPLTPALEYFLSESQWIELHAGQTDAALAKVVDAVRRQRGAEPAKPSAYLESKTSHSSKRPQIMGFALVGLLVAVVAYFVVQRFPGSGLAKQSPSEAASVPAVQTVVPAAPVISEKSVAVLPFVDMSEKKDQEYFSDGLSEELIDMLTKVSDLRVPARTSSFYFKGKSEDIPTIAKRLLVAHVLEGSVRKSGNTVRITAQLIRADNGYHVWSETYDRKLDDIFKIQDEIAGKVVAALQLNLKGGTLPALAGTQSVKAYNLYLQGQQIARMASNDAQNETALNFIRQALTEDPAFVQAWARESQILDDLRRGPEARHAAEEALRLGPDLPDSHTALARVIIVNDSNLRETEKHLKRAIELDPHNSWALSWMGTLAAFKGRFDEGIDIFKNDISRDPVNNVRYRDLANLYFMAGQYNAALAADQRSRELNPGSPGQHFFAAQILMAKGDAAGALAELDLEKDENLRDGCGCRIVMYDALGRKAEADAALAKLEKTSANEDGYEIGRVYANRGDLNAAFTWFDRALRNHEYNLFGIKVDPLLKNVRSDPRFNRLLIKLGLQD
jgi:TolB-like protein